MPPRPYRFGKDKVHPAPAPLSHSDASSSVLCHSDAPWSAPRGYTTSIPEEVAAYKAALPVRKTVKAMKPQLKPQLPLKKFKSQILLRTWRAILDHFKGLADDVLPRQTEENPNRDVAVPRLLLCLCCLRSEIKSQ